MVLCSSIINCNVCLGRQVPIFHLKAGNNITLKLHLHPFSLSIPYSVLRGFCLHGHRSAVALSWELNVMKQGNGKERSVWRCAKK